MKRVRTILRHVGPFLRWWAKESWWVLPQFPVGVLATIYAFQVGSPGLAFAAGLIDTLLVVTVLLGVARYQFRLQAQAREQAGERAFREFCFRQGVPLATVDQITTAVNKGDMNTAADIWMRHIRGV